MRFFVEKCRIYQKKKLFVVFAGVLLLAVALLGRLVYLTTVKSAYYRTLATDLQQRERRLYAARGEIVDRNGVVLATNTSVYTISVIHNQIEKPKQVIQVLSKELNLPEERVRKRVEKVSSIEKIKGNVDRSVCERILSYGLSGIKADEDYRRVYPYGELASKVLGFTGGDHQGILGLEARYDEKLKGTDGTILTYTDARGIEVNGKEEERIEPQAGNTLVTSLDYNIQSYCMQAAEKTYLQKDADGVEIIVMNPQNGEILAMVDYPEYDLGAPFTLTETYAMYEGTDEEDLQRNYMWRNWCVSDTYEPGSIFKIVTTSIALEENLVSLDEGFYCPGYIVVGDRRIRCHKTNGHGSETFTTALYNSCNPVFIDMGMRIGCDRFYRYMEQFDLFEKTGIDLPGESATIMHRKENIGPVELATISFGQSFQVSPIRLMTTASELLNGGNKITPHLGVGMVDASGSVVETFSYEETKEQICSEETSATLRKLLQGVVEEGGGSKAYIEGFEIGGKTATSQTLPRSDNKYISAFLGFAPAENPNILLMVIIRNPQGTYYGGTIAAPVAREILENILPYLDN